MYKIKIAHRKHEQNASGMAAATIKRSLKYLEVIKRRKKRFAVESQRVVQHRIINLSKREEKKNIFRFIYT